MVEKDVLLEVDNLSVSYGKVNAVHDISFKVHKGEIVLLLGRNGVGKTTTVLATTGLIPKRGGRVIFDGYDISSAAPADIVRSGISVVLEGHRIFPELSVDDNLRLGGFGILHGHELNERLEEMYDLFPLLRDKRDERAGRLSGGQQQILAIAQGLIPSPRLLFLDEPSVGIAPFLVGEILELIDNLRKNGMGVVLVEQLVRKAMALGDYVYLLDNGSVLGQGTPAEIEETGLLQRAYFGSSPVG